MVRLISFVFCLMSLVLAVGAGEAYTNLAGKAIAATPVSVNGETVTFACNRSTASSRPISKPQNLETSKPQNLKLPLRAFPPSEQKRIKAAVGVHELPGELKGLAAEIASQRARAEARTKAGRMTPEKLADYKANLAGSWAHAVEEANLSDEEKTYWKGNVP